MPSALPLKLSGRSARMGIEPIPLGLFARVKQEAAQPRRIVAIPYALMFWRLVLSAYLPALRSSMGELSSDSH